MHCRCREVAKRGRSTFSLKVRGGDAAKFRDVNDAFQCLKSAQELEAPPVFVDEDR